MVMRVERLPPKATQDRTRTKIIGKPSSYIRRINLQLGKSHSKADHLAIMKEGGSAFKILIGTPKGKRTLGRPRRRCELNIRVDLK